MGQNLLLAITLIIFSVHVICEEFVCPRSRGYYPHPTECKKYYSCRKRISTLKECPEEMLFDVNKGNCYIYSAVDCGNRKKPTVIVVPMEQIQEKNRTEESRNTDLDIVTETTMASTQGSSGTMLPLKYNTSEVITEQFTDTNTMDNGLSSTTNEIDNSNFTITETSDTKPNTNEIVVDDSNYTSANLYNNTEAFSQFTNGNEVTDGGELNVTITAPTEPDRRTSEEHNKPTTTEDGLNYTRIPVTDVLGNSTIDDTSGNGTNDASAVVTEFTTKSIDESSINYLLNVSTSVANGFNFTTEDNEKFSTSDQDTTVSNWSNHTDYEVTMTASKSTDVSHEQHNTTVREFTDSTSYLLNVSTSVANESDFTAEGTEKFSTSDQDTTVPNWSNQTDYDKNTSKVDEVTTTASKSTNEQFNTTVREFTNSTSTTSNKIETTFVTDRIEVNTTSSNEETTGSTDINNNTIIYSSTEPASQLSTKKATTETELSTIDSNSTDLTHKEYMTTVKEFISSTSNGIETTFVPDGMETNTTSDRVITSTDDDPDIIVIHSSPEPVSHLSTKTTTTEQSRTTVDDYYENDFDCPTPYGRYPHPTDKHKFLHCQEWFPHVMVCPADLIFDAKLEICVWPKRTFIMY